ncbi:MAG TPA: hypothetical protein VER07_05970 [Candidatus Polarisedimenticolia bacterium]|nr:hypothetical protein [Candidatus Polarisedimenticolia bacterium]
MRRITNVFVGLFGAASLLIGGASIVSAHSSHGLLAFDSMKPVTGGAVGTVNDRGIIGGGKPWVITAGSGEVDRNGSVHVSVSGLVIPVAPFNGTNPVAAFGATVSCVTPHGVVNLRTGTAPASAAGDATIDGAVMLPNPCQDPILFVTSPGGAWFAMSNGDDSEAD